RGRPDRLATPLRPDRRPRESRTQDPALPDPAHPRPAGPRPPLPLAAPTPHLALGHRPGHRHRPDPPPAAARDVKRDFPVPTTSPQETTPASATAGQPPRHKPTATIHNGHGRSAVATNQLHEESGSKDHAAGRQGNGGRSAAGGVGPLMVTLCNCTA